MSEYDKIMQLENRFLVVKIEDIHAALDDQQCRQLDYLLDLVHEYRRSQGKRGNNYVVINLDEPYAGIVLGLMQEAENDTHARRAKEKDKETHS